MVRGGGVVRREGKGEREVQVRRAVNDWLVFALCGPLGGVSCKATGGSLLKRRRLGLKLQKSPVNMLAFKDEISLCRLAKHQNELLTFSHNPFPTPLQNNPLGNCQLAAFLFLGGFFGCGFFYDYVLLDLGGVQSVAPWRRPFSALSFSPVHRQQ